MKSEHAHLARLVLEASLGARAYTAKLLCLRTGKVEHVLCDNKKIFPYTVISRLEQ